MEECEHLLAVENNNIPYQWFKNLMILLDPGYVCHSSYYCHMSSLTSSRLGVADPPTQPQTLILCLHRLLHNHFLTHTIPFHLLLRPMTKAQIRCQY